MSLSVVMTASDWEVCRAFAGLAAGVKLTAARTRPRPRLAVSSTLVLLGDALAVLGHERS